jgi:ABC-2 type transport system permease protein
MLQRAATNSSITPSLSLAAVSLCKRELVRFLRQRHRIIGALATPLVFWILIGTGMGRSFSSSGMTPGRGDYLEYFFPGTILMILLFTAIFSTISIIEDRREGFLQGVLVAPVPRSAVVLGKVLGGTLLAFGQGLVFLCLAPTVGIHLGIIPFLLCAFVMLVVSFALTSLGFCIAWRMTSTQGFHAIMNLFLMPLWFLSGALFPPDKSLGAMKWVIWGNPLSYGLAGIRRALYWNNPSVSALLPSWSMCLGISIAFAAILFGLASIIATARSKADLY